MKEKKCYCVLALLSIGVNFTVATTAYRSVTASPGSRWKITIWQSGCNAQTEGWLGRDGVQISDFWGYPTNLICYDSSAYQIIQVNGIPNEALYWIRFDWDRNGEWDEILFNELVYFSGGYWSKTYTHSPETVRIEGTSAVGGVAVSVDKFGLLAPYFGLASTILVATVATTICVKRVKHRKEKQ